MSCNGQIYADFLQGCEQSGVLVPRGHFCVAKWQTEQRQQSGQMASFVDETDATIRGPARIQVAEPPLCG